MKLKLALLILLFSLSCSQRRNEERRYEDIAAENHEPEKRETPDERRSTTETEISFRPVSVLSGNIRMEVPEELRAMNAEMFELKYPLENPETTIAYSDEDATVTLLISPRQETATQGDLPKYQEMLYESFGRNPSIELKKNEIRKINDRDFIVLEMITPAADTRIYNQMFITSSGGRLLICSFNCTDYKQKEWQQIADRILSSVKVMD